MIQLAFDILDNLDSLGINRKPVKSSRLKKPEFIEYIQLSIFDVLKPFAEERLSAMYSLFNQYQKDLNQLKNPDSALFKLLKGQRIKRFNDCQNRLNSLIDSISEFSFMYSLFG